MKYSDLKSASEVALNKGLDLICKKTLPTFWSPDGCGWHEQWMNVDYSGVYAGCEGIILLSQTKRYLDGNEYDRLIKSTYENNLCLIFDSDLEIKHNDSFELKKRNQRDKAINAAFKMAKFLWASSYVTSARNINLEERTSDRLYGLYDDNSGRFRISNSTEGSLLATVFAFIGLCRSNHIRPELMKVEQSFIDFLNKNSVISDANVDGIVLIIWAASQTIGYCSKGFVDKCKTILRDLINNQGVRQNLIIGERYYIRNVGIRDNFSINKYFVFIQALEEFVKHKIVSFDYLRTAVGPIKEIASVVNSYQVYSKDGNLAGVLFWENYYALQLLNGFLEILSTYMPEEEQFMIISPKLFKGDDYTINDQLCVVIMPFRCSWSSEIYDTFKEATTGFTVWRSDEEYRDDVIIQTVWDQINRARFIIADCTEKNPNVFYELGIAHTLGKPVFMCAQNREDFPFDINHIRSFQYGLMPSDIRKLKAEIREFIKNL